MQGSPCAVQRQSRQVGRGGMNAPALNLTPAFAAPEWHADPVVAEIIACMRQLSAVGQKLRTLSGELAIQDAASAVGEVASIFERGPETAYAYAMQTRANGGVCADLWAALDDRRRTHMKERLDGEGMDADTVEGFERSMEIDAETLSVADAFAQMSAGNAAKWGGK